MSVDRLESRRLIRAHCATDAAHATQHARACLVRSRRNCQEHGLSVCVRIVLDA